MDRKAANTEQFEDYLIFFAFAPNNDVVMDFEVVKIIGEQTAPVFGTLYETEDDFGTLDHTLAVTFLDGSIKWDGCSNWDFHTNECMAHFCGVRQATSIGRLMQRMYEITAESMPKFDNDLAGMR